MSNVREVNTSNFQQEVVNSTEPVVVDFYATWCPPCKMLAPILDQLAREYAGRIKVVKVNTDHEVTLAGQFRIQGVPTLIFIKNGRIVDQVVGALPEAELRRKLDALANAV